MSVTRPNSLARQQSPRAFPVPPGAGIDLTVVSD
jgi:hypothetical protein